MKNDTAGGLGLDYKVSVYSSVEEFDKAAVDKDNPTGRPGACLETANTSLVYRGGAAGKFRKELVDALVKATGFARLKTGTTKNAKGEVKDVFEGEEKYMNRFRATAKEGKNDAFVKAGFVANEEQCEGALQGVADKLGPYVVDASTAQRSGSGAPKKTPAMHVKTATMALEKDPKATKAVAAITKDGIVMPALGGTPTTKDADIAALAKGIWQREQKLAQAAAEQRATTYA